MSHVEKRRQLWYATLKVPPHLHAQLGRTKFLQSLHTADKRRATHLAVPLIALWKATIRQADGEPEAVEVEALRWRQVLAEAGQKDDDGYSLDALSSVMTDKAEAIEQARGEEAAVRFADIASGRKTPSGLHLEEWKASLANLAPKTQDQSVKDVQKLLARFATLEEMTSTALRRYGAELTKAGQSPASIRRQVSFWRSYWKHLKAAEVVPADSDPFKSITLPSEGRKGARKSGWVPFKPEDVPTLWTAAEALDDAQLADLIRLGAYTGARIEELCALKVQDVHLAGALPCLRIVDAKTDAGVREVPVHPAILPLLKRLAKESDDGYLMTAQPTTKYGERSGAIGKRFGRLKRRLTYTDQHVFHSLRKTVVTMLEDAGVSENLAADIVGHEKPRITYGLYSGGASLRTKAEALARVAYPAA